MADKHLYKVIFINQGKVYELYAKNVSQADMYGFVMLEDITFGETSGVLIDPSEERLRSEFEGVRRSFIPMHAVIRIDEVKKQGSAKIVALDGKPADITHLANTYTQPGGGKSDS